MKCLILMVAVLISTVIADENELSEDVSDGSVNVVKSLAGKRFRRATRLVKTYAFDSEYQSVATDAHNKARRSVSPPASNMKKMEWDGDLARLATNYASMCTYEHNPDRSIGIPYYVGENLHLSYGIPYTKAKITQVVESWDKEKDDYNYAGNACKPGAACGHYTQVVWADSFKVGCGAALCSSITLQNGNVWHDATIVVCNYGPGGNIKGNKPYKQGRPCSQCEKGFNLCENGLCGHKQTGVPPKTIPGTGQFEGKWSKWSSWSKCSKPCGGGSRSRARDCSSKDISDCNGNMYDSKECNIHPCESKPSNKWGPWGQWSPCTVSCGYGKKSRTRSCPHSDPKKPCYRRSSETRSCFLKECTSTSASKQWGPWGAWSPCSATCGYGRKTRLRGCPPSKPKTPCRRSSKQTASCLIKSCPSTGL